MASSNRLLGSGVEYKETKTSVAAFDVPCLLYHETCLGGKIVHTVEDRRRLLQEGWKDHPGKVRRLPGHEKIYDEEMKKAGSSVPGMKISKVK